ncbi:unnamed protein product, partial [Brenthis ino]
MFRITSGVILAVCAICASQPVEKLPILKELPQEVLFKENSELVLECVTVDKDPGVQYSWIKDGKPLALSSNIVQRENEGTLVFKKPSTKDEGEYICLAQTNLGVASSRTVNVRRTYIEIPDVTIQKHKPLEGKYYKLDCHIPNAYPKPEIVWLYQSIADPSISRTILDRRITQSPGGTLYFTNVTKEDTSRENKYVCTAKSLAVDKDVVLAEHIIESVVPSDDDNSALMPLYVSPDMIAKVNDVTMIYCIYGGTPLAYPDWYKDGKNTNNNPQERVTRYNRTSGKRLLIKETWASDQGEYTCIVDNEVGEPQKHTMHLTVVSSPQLLEHAEQKLLVKVGDHVSIPCHVAGIPAPKISLTRNNQALPSNAVLNESTHGNITVSDITIQSVQKDNTGYYGCRARNEYGEVYVETLLYVQ